MTENVTWKYYFILFVLLRDYFNPSNLHKNSKLPRNQIGRRDVRVKEEIKNITVECPRSPQNLEFGL